MAHTSNIVGINVPQKRRVLGASRLGAVTIIDPKQAAEALTRYARALDQISFAKDVLSRNPSRGLLYNLSAMITRAEDYIKDYPVSLYIQIATTVVANNSPMPANVSGYTFNQFTEAAQAAYATALEVESQPDTQNPPGGGAPPNTRDEVRKTESWLDQEKGLLIVGGLAAIAFLAFAID